jgi:hypothetical protein
MPQALVLRSAARRPWTKYFGVIASKTGNSPWIPVNSGELRWTPVDSGHSGSLRLVYLPNIGLFDNFICCFITLICIPGGLGCSMCMSILFYKNKTSGSIQSIEFRWIPVNSGELRWAPATPAHSGRFKCRFIAFYRFYDCFYTTSASLRAVWVSLMTLSC